MDTTLVLALLSGVGIAAASGLRAFLPLLAVGLAGRFHLLPLRPGSEWLASDAALWALGLATVLELAGDKVPAIDHALDAVGTVLRPAAAWIGGIAVLVGWGSPWAQIAALVFGAGALAVHATKSSARVGASALTFGFGNPFISFVEDGTAIGLLVLAILVPLVAALAVAAGVVVILRWLFGDDGSRERRAA
jgi:hypothetical protein